MYVHTFSIITAVRAEEMCHVLMKQNMKLNMNFLSDSAEALMCLTKVYFTKAEQESQEVAYLRVEYIAVMVSSILFLTTAILCAFSALCDAIHVGKGIVRIDDQNFGLFRGDIPLNLTDTKLSIGFTLVDSAGAEDLFVVPQQVTVSLANENVSTELYFEPKLLKGKVYETNILTRDISPFLLSQDSIEISIITGDPVDSSYNAILKAGTLNPSAKLKKDNVVTLPTRFSAQKEIHHVFREAPKNLPAFVSTQFTFSIVLCLVVLLLAWNYFDAANVNNISKFNPLSLLFLVTIFIFEYCFFDYYLGASIFTSLYRFAVVGAFSIYFGSKALTDMYKLRTKNLR